MKEKIRTMLEDALPLVDFDSDFLFSELDSLGVTTTGGTGRYTQELEDAG